MSLIKSPIDIQKLRVAGKKLASVLQKASQFAQPGIRLLDLEKKIETWIHEEGATPSFLGYDNYPYSSCLSVNDQVVHGIPNEYILKIGDVLGIDVGLWYDNVCVDSAVTVAIGEINDQAKKLLEGTQEALKAGIKAVKPYRRVGAISQAIQEVGESHRFGIVRALTGHGVGHAVHEEPSIPNIGKSSDGMLLRAGMVLAIEPMFTLGKGEVHTEIDGWGIVTADKSLAAQFEHTVVVTNHGVEILTIS